MKKFLALLLAVLMVLTLAACGKKEEPAPAGEGKVFHIMAWNEEYKGFFEKYYQSRIPADVTVKWTIVPNEGSQYQDAVDLALQGQASASADDKVDMFLAEADYILKYVNSDATQDVKKLGVTDFSNTYQYTVDACTDTNGVVKGVSFQCCPSALIYRRSIAKDVLGTDDPVEVQAKLDSWDKFDAVAAEAKAKGYLMTASYAETYRVFSNNVSTPWVDKDNNLQMDPQIQKWLDQSESYIANGYTITAGVWDGDKNAHMYDTGKALCFFGPAWYFNFCMGPTKDADHGTMGDWAICEGPQAHFWGGTWLLAASGSDNPTILADVMNTFINDEEVCSNLIKNESQFTNNQKVNAAFAADPEYKNDLLEQNDVAVFVELAKNIQFKNQTIYDQGLNEGLQNNWSEFLKGAVTKEVAMENFYKAVAEQYPSIVLPQ